jgi:hypothetical protein
MQILKIVSIAFILSNKQIQGLQIPAVKQDAMQIKSANQGQMIRMHLGIPLLKAEQFVVSSTFWKGVLAGGLHAISGPDHYPSILPRCIGKRWYDAGSIGAVWGIGHSLSAFALGLFVFMIKDRATLTSTGVLDKISAGANLAVGFSMIMVGLFSLYESKIQKIRMKASESLVNNDVLINGLCHGMAIDGLPTMIPVLAADSFPAAALFLLSYGIGGIVAMAAATIFIGHSSVSLAQSADFDLAQLINVSSIGAILVGLAWVIFAMVDSSQRSEQILQKSTKPRMLEGASATILIPFLSMASAS